MYKKILSVILVFLFIGCGMAPGDKTSNKRWFVSVEGTSQGPYTLNQIKDMDISEETNVLLEGTNNWVAVKDVPEIMDMLNKKYKEAAAGSKTDVPFEKHSIINSDNPGQQLNVTDYIIPGYINVFDFYSNYCPPCRQIAPYLEKLAEARSDVVVRKILIDRTGSRGIDWGSPITQQYGIRSVPNFWIYYPDKKIWVKGKDAYRKVVEMLKNIH